MYRENISKGKEVEIKFKNKIVKFRKYKEKFNVYTPIQKHTDIVLKIENRNEPKRVGDAVITNLKNFEIGVKTADCVPIVLVGNEWVGVIHAGWRGLHKGIIEKTLKEFEKEDKVLKAFIFPSAKSCCYEVGKEFKEIFENNLIEKNGKLFFDPQNEALHRLKKYGIKTIEVFDICTICNPKLPSFRRDKTVERMLTSVVIL